MSRLHQSLLRDELHQTLIDLGIIEEDDEQVDINAVNTKIKVVGFNKDMFESALSAFKEGTTKAYQQMIKQTMADLFELPQNGDAIEELVIPLSELDLNINNAVYSEYEHHEAFYHE